MLNLNLTRLDPKIKIDLLAYLEDCKECILQDTADCIDPEEEQGLHDLLVGIEHAERLLSLDDPEPLKAYRCPQCNADFDKEEYIPDEFFCPVCRKRLLRTTLTEYKTPETPILQELKQHLYLDSGNTLLAKRVLVSGVKHTRTIYAEVYTPSFLEMVKTYKNGNKALAGAINRRCEALRKQPIRKADFQWQTVSMYDLTYKALIFRAEWLAIAGMDESQETLELKAKEVFTQMIQGKMETHYDLSLYK
jgi:DNA-directed RNA polymerase subunit RPC12/RpoP